MLVKRLKVVFVDEKGEEFVAADFTGSIALRYSHEIDVHPFSVEGETPTPCRTGRFDFSLSASGTDDTLSAAAASDQEDHWKSRGR